MRNFVNRLLYFRLRRKPSKTSQRTFHDSPSMSAAGMAAALYAATISPSLITGAVPEEAKDKAHHLKKGKGFYNPWDSHPEKLPGPAIAMAIIK